MLVAVGSKNKSKLSGVNKAYKLFMKDCEVLGVEVAKELPPQPMDLSSTFNGALFRALRSLELVDEAEHGVGVEAGLFVINDIWFDVHVAAIVDRNERVTYGLSPAFEVPPRFVKELLEKRVNELEVLVDKHFKTKDVGEHGGFIKFLTNGQVLRDDLTYYSVMMALIPRINKELYSS
ncbi:MAG: inosine/xanthosine triphosphatase [Sulfolobales archaeon]